MARYFYIHSNSNLRISDKGENRMTYKLSLREHGIENASDLPDELCVTYLIDDRKFSSQPCTICNGVSDTKKRLLKIVRVDEADQKTHFHIESLERRDIFSEIIEKMRRIFCHNRFICMMCDPLGNVQRRDH